MKTKKEIKRCSDCPNLRPDETAVTIVTEKKTGFLVSDGEASIEFFANYHDRLGPMMEIKMRKGGNKHIIRLFRPQIKDMGLLFYEVAETIAYNQGREREAALLDRGR